MRRNIYQGPSSSLALMSTLPGHTANICLLSAQVPSSLPLPWTLPGKNPLPFRGAACMRSVGSSTAGMGCLPGLEARGSGASGLVPSEPCRPLVQASPRSSCFAGTRGRPWSVQASPAVRLPVHVAFPRGCLSLPKCEGRQSYWVGSPLYSSMTAS